MTSRLKVFDVVALLIDYHDQGLVRGQVGTVVEQLGENAFEVEFSDDTGRTYAEVALNADAILVLVDEQHEAQESEQVHR